MSWWNTGSGEDVIGDRPADVLAAAFRGTPAPTLRELLDTSAAVLREHGDSLVADAERTRVVKLDIEPAPAAGTPGDTTRPELAASLLDAFEQVAALYEDRWSRPPRLSELLAAMAFVLRPVPRPWLDAGGDTPVDDVVAR